MNKLITLLIFFFLITPSSVIAEPDLLSARKKLQFPEDHGRHDEFPIEWWYFSGHLTTEDNHSYGFQLVFFKVVNELIKSKQHYRENLKDNSLYLAHFALTDDQANKFYYSEKYQLTNSLKQAAAQNRLAVNLSDWSAIMQDDGIIKLNASHADKNNSFELSLKLNSKKPIVKYGEDGFIKNNEKSDHSSFHYSLSRLSGTGQIRINKKLEKVKVSAWMDREILTDSKPELKWDWYAIQLDDQREVVIYQIRSNKNLPAKSRAYIISKEGTLTKFNSNNFSIAQTGNWQSDVTEKTYPSGWELKIPQEDLNLKIVPTVKNQEFPSKIDYWEGRSKVFTADDQLVGNAYVELVGY